MIGEDNYSKWDKYIFDISIIAVAVPELQGCKICVVIYLTCLYHCHVEILFLSDPNEFVIGS